MPSAHQKALVFLLENLWSNIMISCCYLHCACSMSKNWLAMMHQDYQAEKLLKRLQNKPIENHVKFKKFPKSTTVASSVWLLHSLVIIVTDALVQSYIIGSTNTYQDVALFFAITFCGLSQSWPLRFDNMGLNSEKLTTRRATSLMQRKVIS